MKKNCSTLTFCGFVDKRMIFAFFGNSNLISMCSVVNLCQMFLHKIKENKVLKMPHPKTKVYFVYNILSCNNSLK